MHGHIQVKDSFKDVWILRSLHYVTEATYVKLFVRGLELL